MTVNYLALFQQIAAKALHATHPAHGCLAPLIPWGGDGNYLAGDDWG